jgi:transposase InsO family protein
MGTSTIIDVLSKYAWVEAIKAKTGENLVKSFEKIIKKGCKPKMVHTDTGAEFINKQFQTFLKKHDIRYFWTYNETKASIVEMFNRSLKTKMWKYFTANNTLKYVDILQKLVSTS